MDGQQFAQFVAAEQADRAAARDAAHQHHLDRQQALQEASNRQLAETLIRKIPGCDGGTTKSVREWIREVEYTIPYSGQTVFIAAHSAEGPLRRELDRFLDTAPNRNAVTWQQLKLHLEGAFLSRHEAERLRDEVEKVTQAGYESVAAYSRRFRDTADLGFPPANRNDDQDRHLLRTFMKGLRDRHMVERLVKEGRPDDLDEAIDLVAQYDSDDYVLHRTLTGVAPQPRDEQPMEIGGIYSAQQAVSQATPPAARQDTSDNMQKLQRQVSGMTRELTKLVATIKQQPAPVREKQKPRSRLRFTPDGKPICLKCNKPGHIKKECRSDPRRNNNPKTPAQGGQ